MTNFFNMYNFSMLLACLFNSIIGLFVYFKNRAAYVNRFFGLYCFILTIWVFGCFIESSFLNHKIALLADKILYTGCILAAPAYLHFCHIITRKQDKWHVLPFFYGLAFIWLLINFIDPLRRYFILDVIHRYSFRYIASPGPLWYAFILLFNIQVLYMFSILYSNFKKQSSHEKTKAKYLLVAFFIMIASSSFYFLLLLNIVTPPIDAYLLIIYVSIMAYAIVRHQLMDIAIIIKKTLVFTGLFVFVYAVFACMAYLMQAIFQNMIGVNRWIAMIPSVAIVIFTLKPLEKFLVNTTDKYLFQKKYDYKELLNAFSTEVLTVLDLDRLADLAASKLVEIMKLDSCAVLLLDEEKREFSVRASRGAIDTSLTFPPSIEMKTLIKQVRPYVLAKDVATDSDRLPSSVYRAFTRLKAELAMPVISRDEVIGMVFMGKKRSDEEYSQEDLDILLPLSRALGIAISNADLFNEYGKVQAKAAESDKMAAIGTLAASMAHEIRSPITTIRIFSEYVPSKMRDPDFRSKYKNIVIKEVDKIDHIIQTLIDFSDSNTSIEKEKISLSGSIDELVSSECIDADAKKNIKFVKNIPGSLPDISVNRKELEEILLNLCQNAAHAMSGSGEITFTATEKEHTVELKVKDTGCGMSEELLTSIFLPFFTTRSKGFGLGLFVARELVIRNGGHISVMSKVGEGTTFTLEFAIASPGIRDIK